MEPVSPENKSPFETTIRLGQEFRPFTLPSLDFMRHGQFIGHPTIDQPIISIILASEVLPPLPYAIVGSTTQFSDPDFAPFFAPFLPEGYRVTESDMQPETRRQKLIDYLKSHPTRADVENLYEMAPLELYVCVPADIEELGLGSRLRPGRKMRFNEGILPLITRLRLVLTLPAGRFESRPDVQNGDIAFGSFYPYETGPLPPISVSEPQHVRLDEGLDVHLPAKKEDLDEVRMKFILLPERHSGGDIQEASREGPKRTYAL